MSTNKNEPSHIYFLEDALELWLAVVQNSTTLTPELLGLTGNLLPIIGKPSGKRPNHSGSVQPNDSVIFALYNFTENSSEYIRTVFSIIQAYILLNAEVYLQQHGKSIVETCIYLLTDMRSEGVVMVMRMYESILRAMGTYGIEILRPALPDIFK